MSQKSSTFIQETREREAWLAPAVEREGGDAREREQLLATAAVIRGVAQAVVVPEDTEERARHEGAQLLQRLHLERLSQRQRPEGTRAPWYLRLGHFMRYVFTLGRRR